MTSDGEPARRQPLFEDLERFDARREISSQHSWDGEPDQRLDDRLVARNQDLRSARSATAASAASSFSAPAGMRYDVIRHMPCGARRPSICTGEVRDARDEQQVVVRRLAFVVERGLRAVERLGERRAFGHQPHELVAFARLVVAVSGASRAPLALELTAPLCPLQRGRRHARKLTILAGLPSTTASTCPAHSASAAAFSVAV